MLVTQFDKFVNRSTQEILGSDIENENLEPMFSTDIVRNVGGVTGVKGEKEVYYRTGNVNLTSADIGALDEDNVYNGLDQTDPGYALDARQGKVLDDAIDGKLDKANVYNDLDQTDPGYALDARQGKALSDKLEATQSDIASKIAMQPVFKTLTGITHSTAGSYVEHAYPTEWDVNNTIIVSLMYFVDDAWRPANYGASSTDFGSYFLQATMTSTGIKIHTRGSRCGSVNYKLMIAKLPS